MFDDTNNLTIAGNLFSAHIYCADEGSLITYGPSHACLRRDEAPQNFIFSNNVVTRHPQADVESCVTIVAVTGFEYPRILTFIH